MSETPFIPSLDQIRDLELHGLVKVDSYSDLILATYTNKQQFSGKWDEVVMACRGIILRVDQPWPSCHTITEVVSLPWSKFFNYGERFPSSPLLDVTEKLDGVFGILWRLDGEIRVATRHRFMSPPALWATQKLQYHNLHSASHPLPAEWTLMFELISPEIREVNQLAIDYGDVSDLYLLGVRDRFTGRDLSRAEVQEIATTFHFRHPKVYSGEDVEGLLVRAKALPSSVEGFVLRFEDGTRLKIKGDGYKTISRAMKNCNPKHVLETIRDGCYDEFVMAIPEELRPEVETWGRQFESRAKATFHDLMDYSRQEMPCCTDRKAYAIWAKDRYPDRMSELMLIFQGRWDDALSLIYKKMLEAL